MRLIEDIEIVEMKKLVVNFVAIIALLGMASCGDETAPSASLNFNLNVDGEDLIIGQTYNLGDPATLVDFEVAQFYISDVRLIDSDGVAFEVNGDFLISPGNTQISLGTIDAATYKTLEFGVGVDAVRNHEDPLELNESSVLSPQNPSMHWSWQNGYRFIRIDGKFDSDENNAIEESDEAFQLHIGNDAYFRTVQIPYDVEAFDGDQISLELKTDFAILVDYDVAANKVVHTSNPNEFFDGISSNIPAAFSR